MEGPKYHKECFEVKGFIFVEHMKPFDIWVRDDEKILYCQPCLKFFHFKNKVQIKSIRGYPHQVKEYVNSL